MELVEESICFHYELGLAMTLWARVENTLGEVVATAFPPKNRFKVGVGFLSIDNFRSKLTFADSIIHEAKLSSRRMKEWEALVKRIASASVKRNKLAHGRVFIYPGEVPGRRFALGNWKLMKDPHKNTKPTSESMCLRDIVELKNEFFAVIVTLSNFSDRLQGGRASMPLATQTPAPVPTLKTMRTQLRASLPPLK